MLRHMIDEVLEEDACFSIKDLAINGWDLQQAGFAPGPVIGQCLSWLLGQVQDEVLPILPIALGQVGLCYLFAAAMCLTIFPKTLIKVL